MRFQQSSSRAGLAGAAAVILQPPIAADGTGRVLRVQGIVARRPDRRFEVVEPDKFLGDIASNLLQQRPMRLIDPAETKAGA